MDEDKAELVMLRAGLNIPVGTSLGSFKPRVSGRTTEAGAREIYEDTSSFARLAFKCYSFWCLKSALPVNFLGL